MSEQATQIDDGGQAFPAYRGYDAKPPHVPGQTLRDYFAAKAMQALLSRPSDEIAGDAYEPEKDNHRAALVARSYEVADAMIAARKK